jgi:hypothetical protein
MENIDILCYEVEKMHSTLKIIMWVVIIQYAVILGYLYMNT